MNYGIRRRLPISQLEIGMIIAEDVITPTGIMLIPAHTVLTQRNIFRLELYQILSVVVRDNAASASLEVEEEEFSIHKDPNFIEFENSYRFHVSELKEQLDSISKGNSFDVNGLYTVTSSMLSTLKSTTNLFRYLHHLKIHDDYTYFHCLNVSLICNIFGNWLQLDREILKNLTISGLLHDIGKISIGIDILNKPTKLTDDEFSLIKKHPILGYDMVKDSPIPDSIKQGILMHHEKFDGSGYPYGLKMDQIHTFGKIISIVDIYDAMTSDRTYHKKFSPFQVIRMFEQEAYGVLDTYLLIRFLKNIADNYLGCIAKLSNGEKGKIVFVSPKSPSRPILQLDHSMLDMQSNHNLEIVEIL